MKCPHCGKESKGLVLETRTRDGDLLRRRSCGHCGQTFVTREYVDAELKIPRLQRRKRETVSRAVDSKTLAQAWR